MFVDVHSVLARYRFYIRNVRDTRGLFDFGEHISRPENNDNIIHSYNDISTYDIYDNLFSIKSRLHTRSRT